MRLGSSPAVERLIDRRALQVPSVPISVAKVGLVDRWRNAHSEETTLVNLSVLTVGVHESILRAPMAKRLLQHYLPIGDVTPVYSITLSTVASNLDGSFRPNVLAVLSRRFSLSVPFWLPWTIVHLQREGS